MTEKVGPSIRFTEVQMRMLFNTFIHKFIGDRTNESYNWVARWLKNGQPWVHKGEIKRPGGHTVYARIWSAPDRWEGACVLWLLIGECVDGWGDRLTKAQVRAFRRRQEFLETHIKQLNPLELLARV